VGIQDNFFDLGGHSLLAIQVISRIRELGMGDLQVHVFFDSPTIAALGLSLDKQAKEKNLNETLIAQPRRALRRKPQQGSIGGSAPQAAL